MTENQTLRNLLRNLASFVGDGAGGLLPKLGWEMSDFNNYINRSETDTAWEGYQRRKKTGDATTPVSATSQGHKRSPDDDPTAVRSKKARRNDESEAERTQSGFSLLVPVGQPLATNNMYPSGSRHGMFPDMMHNSNGSPMFMPSAQPSTSSQYGTVTNSNSNVNNYSSSYLPGVGIPIDSQIPTMAFNPPNNTVSAQQQQRLPPGNQPSEQLDDDDDPNKNEAQKLIQYASVLCYL